MPGRIIDTSGIPDISDKLLLPNGKMRLMPADELKSFDTTALRLFCHHHGRYGLPTTELVDFIRNHIGTRSAIEIGAGYGDTGYHLGIPMTDSHLQSDPGIRAIYQINGQPVIEYPPDIEKLEALQAIRKYRPEVVIGSWITRWINPKKPRSAECRGSIFGVKEPEMLRQVKCYILIGNLDIHQDKPIFRRPHSVISEPWIVSRAQHQENNRIFIWERQK